MTIWDTKCRHMLKGNGTGDAKGGLWKDCAHLSSCAKRDLWQSPKSKPQIFTFLSAEPVAISAPSYEEERKHIASTWSFNTVEKDKLPEHLTHSLQNMKINAISLPRAPTLPLSTNLLKSSLSKSFNVSWRLQGRVVPWWRLSIDLLSR